MYQKSLFFQQSTKKSITLLTEQKCLRQAVSNASVCCYNKTPTQQVSRVSAFYKS